MVYLVSSKDFLDRLTSKNVHFLDELRSWLKHYYDTSRTTSRFRS